MGTNIKLTVQYFTVISKITELNIVVILFANLACNGFFAD